MDPVFYSFVILIAIGTIMVLVALRNLKHAKQSTPRGYRAARSYSKTAHRYVPGQFSDQMELDLRLPYQRFKQLYPESRWTYEEYKRLQMQTAFRRSYSSQDNKRMVR